MRISIAKRKIASSVRPEEVAFYSKINDWWSPNGP